LTTNITLALSSGAQLFGLEFEGDQAMRNISFMLLGLIFSQIHAPPAQAIMPTTLCIPISGSPFLDRLTGVPRADGKRIEMTDNVCPLGQERVEGGTSGMNDPYRYKRTLFPSLSIRLATIVGVFFMLAFLVGWRTRRTGLDANYSRKIFGSGMIIVSLLPVYGFAPHSHFPALILSYAAVFLSFILFVSPIRRRIAFFDIGFSAIDRIEDRPNTLLWFATSYFACALVVVLGLYLTLGRSIGRFHLGLPDVTTTQLRLFGLSIMAVAIGDIVSGVVGFKFGKHRYKAPSLAKAKSYTRSLEGSAAMLASSALTIAILGSGLQHNVFLLALIILPIVITVSEALSPHTWDDPIMLAAAFAASSGIAHIGS
jgi:dolichol kinase